MFNSGASRLLISFQDPTETVDALGSPTQTWVQKCLLHAEVENEEFTVTDTMSTGPRKESVKNMTLIVRNSPSLGINARMRAVDSRSGSIYSISGIRYDAKKTKCFIDVVGGVSKG